MPSVTTSGAPCQYPDLIPGILPFGTLSILAGGSGAGKTTQLAELCARLLTGRTFCGHQTTPPPGGIFYLAADRSWESDHALWFKAAACPPVQVFSLQENIQNLNRRLLTWQYVEDLFLHCMSKLLPPPGSFVILDPLAPMFVAGDINNQRQVATTLLWMGAWAADHELTMLTTVYQGKQKTDPNRRYARKVDRIAGSMAFAGYTHTQIYVLPPEEGEAIYHFGWKPRHAVEQEFEFVRDPTTGLFIPYVTPLDSQEQTILGLLPSDGSATDAQHLHRDYNRLPTPNIPVSRPTFYRALKRLVRMGLLHRVRQGHYALVTH